MERQRRLAGGSREGPRRFGLPVLYPAKSSGGEGETRGAVALNPVVSRGMGKSWHGGSTTAVRTSLHVSRRRMERTHGGIL